MDDYLWMLWMNMLTCTGINIFYSINDYHNNLCSHDWIYYSYLLYADVKVIYWIVLQSFSCLLSWWYGYFWCIINFFFKYLMFKKFVRIIKYCFYETLISTSRVYIGGIHHNHTKSWQDQPLWPIMYCNYAIKLQVIIIPYFISVNHFKKF